MRVLKFDNAVPAFDFAQRHAAVINLRLDRIDGVWRVRVLGRKPTSLRIVK